MRRLPSPCEGCSGKGCPELDCSAYRLWINAQWQRFNRAFVEEYRQKRTSDKFYYPHPDAVRRYLTQGVCAGCPGEEVCEMPCPAYWRWWDARMEIARKKG